MVSSCDRRERQRHLVQDLAAGHRPADVAGDLVRHAHVAEALVDATDRRPRDDVPHLDVGDVAGLRVVVGVGLRDDGDALHQVELGHQVLLAHVQVDGSGVQRRVRAVLVRRSQQLAGLGDHDRIDVPSARADVDRAMGCLLAAIVPGLASSHQLPALGHAVHGCAHVCGLAEEPELGFAEREFPGGAPQMRLQDVRVRGVDHRGFGGTFEQVGGVVHEVLVQRIVLGNQDRERVGVPATGSPHLLPHGGAGARVAGEDGGVERADVDAQLQRTGGCDRQQLAVGQLALDATPVLGEVAGPVALDALPASPARPPLGGRTRRAARRLAGTA